MYNIGIIYTHIIYLSIVGFINVANHVQYTLHPRGGAQEVQKSESEQFAVQFTEEGNKSKIKAQPHLLRCLKRKPNTTPKTPIVFKHTLPHYNIFCLSETQCLLLKWRLNAS